MCIMIYLHISPFYSYRMAYLLLASGKGLKSSRLGRLDQLVLDGPWTLQGPNMDIPWGIAPMIAI